MTVIMELLKKRAYAQLRRELATTPRAELAAHWPSLAPLEKLTLFKLLDATAAMELYDALPFEERYFLLGGFPLQSIAPILEDLPPVERRQFVQLPRDSYERMFRSLLAAAPAAGADPKGGRARKPE